MRIRTCGAVASLLLASFLSTTAPLEAQALGPQRQLLAVEPYYSHIMLDAGEGEDRIGLNGFGGRLWLNLAPFSGPSDNIIGRMALGLFVSGTPEDEGLSTLHYGAQFDYFFVDYPLGGRIDPFISLAGGGFRVKVTGPFGGSETSFALTPGAGIRIPLANRFQLRGDARDIIIFGSETGAGGDSRTAHNWEFLAALGVTF